jgi:flagellar P-ring protein precursor FlgI
MVGSVFRHFTLVSMRTIASALLIFIGSTLAVTPAAEATRLKDIVSVEGVRENQLLGYGVVVGVRGTGDSLRNCAFTRQSLESMMERLGINTRNSTLNTSNAAAVMVTANLPPFSTAGSRIDVTVSAICDSESLEGGQLIATPLLGADGEVYALAQGSVAVGSFTAGGQSGSSVTRNVPTTGRIPNGALIERELTHDFAGQSQIRLALRNPDFTTAVRIAGAINRFTGSEAATASDPATVRLRRPEGFRDMAELLSEIELLQIEPDQAARVIINETTGVIVMGDNVRVSTVAIAQGNLTIQVSEQPAVSQPQPFAEGETVVVPQTELQVEEDTADLAVLQGGVPLRELVDGLNALGVSPRDLISILQALKAAGALHAELEIM